MASRTTAARAAAKIVIARLYQTPRVPRKAWAWKRRGRISAPACRRSHARRASRLHNSNDINYLGAIAAVVSALRRDLGGGSKQMLARPSRRCSALALVVVSALSALG